MMNVLILGGTRFVGLYLVQLLLVRGHHVTTFSRRQLEQCDRLKCVVGERDDLVVRNLLDGFDVVVDFTAHSDVAVQNLFKKIGTARYIMVSSVWLTQLEGENDSEQPRNRRRFTAVERNYLGNKLDAEKVVTERFQAAGNAMSIRSPVTLGVGDHTGRFSHYLRRILNSAPILLVDGGENFLQIAWKNDIANALATLIENDSEFRSCVAEALPVSKTSLNDFVTAIGASDDEGELDVVSVDLHYLERNFPNFLEYEPFWREVEFLPKYVNLFDMVSMKPTGMTDWVARTARNDKSIAVATSANEIEADRMALEMNIASSLA